MHLNVLSPGGRVGRDVSTSLSVEPPGKLLAVGGAERPSSKSVIWKQRGRCLTHLLSIHCKHLQRFAVRMDGSDFLYLFFDRIYSAVHVIEAGAVHALCKKERHVSTLQQTHTHMLLLRHLSFLILSSPPCLFHSCFFFSSWHRR